MFNPFKYRPVSQEDDEDEDILYQGNNIPLSNLGEGNFGDEVDMELPRKSPTARRRSPLALCFVIAICIIFVSLLITLIFYIASPSVYFNGQESSSTTVTQSAVVAHHVATLSSTVSSSSSVVVIQASVSSSTLPAPTSTAYKSISTAVEVPNNELQSTTSTKSDIVANTVTIDETSVVSRTFESTPTSSSSTVVSSTETLPVWTTATVSTDVELLSPMIMHSFTLTSTPTNDFRPSNTIVETMYSMTSLTEPNVTANGTVTSSETVYQSSHIQSTESATSMPIPTDLPTADNSTIHWHKMNLEATSESTPFVIDVNNDGIDDIIFTYAAYTKDLNMYYCPSSVEYENACMKDAGYPVCGAVVVAVNGLNGEVIWLRNMTRPVFGIRCVMDVDDDGETDCFVIGRYHQWDTIDKATGDMIWEADKSIGYPGYNFYYPLPLEDFDGDGVVDILNVHGGDQSYGPEEIDRSPALIVILSGKTGKKLIDPIVVPDGHESYMSPVRYTLGDKDVVLFGTGGETITGSLWAITVDSIKQYVESVHLTSSNDTEYIGCHNEFAADKDKFRPKYDATIYQLENQSQQPSFDCPSFGQHLPITNKYKLCLYELYDSSSKGMIIPPVIIDMNSDNVQDLIIQSFGGHVLCLDGVDGGVLWDRHIPGSESYNVPSPLFYNDDDTPDLFLRVNIGEWDDYNYSYVVIIDGTDGKALWAMNSSYATMQSAVTLMSVNHSQDAVVFFAYNPIDTKNINSTTVKRRQMDNVSSEKPSLNMSTPTNNFDSTSTVDEDANDLNEDPVDVDEGEHIDEAIADFDEEIKHLGEQFWNLSNASFPDPLVDPKGFIESCKFDTDEIEQQSYLYFITRDTATDDNIHPIAAAFPGILIPGHGMISSHNTEKRHGGTEASLNVIQYVSNNAWRCSYVQSPSTYSPVTPVIADLNHDGKLEMIYAFQFTSDNYYFAISYIHSVYDLHVQTIENMAQSDLIDFSKFLPMEEQSWTTYMGSKGDGIYHFGQV